LLKLINKLLIGIRSVWVFIRRAQKAADLRGLSKNPLFYFKRQKSNIFTKLRPSLKAGNLYFALFCFILFGAMYVSCDSLANINGLNNSHVVFFNSFFNKYASPDSNGLFSSQANAIPLETPDLKIIQDNTLCETVAPCAVSAKVLGDTFGGTGQNRKDVSNYTVQPGDTLQSVANGNNISVDTLLWANSLTNSSTIKVGQTLTILPTDGLLHVVKSGNTVSAIAQTYKVKVNDIISFNNLANQDDIYIGDILIIPGGIMPKKVSSTINNNQVPLADNYFIFPTSGRITQGLHYYNAIDVANSCGTPIYAAASGVVQRAVFNNSWNLGMGNYVTILHPNGTVTYYGHFENVFVKPGDKVTVGDRIGLMGRTGNATGCHVHFEVVGAKNPLAKYSVGSTISYK
jgi:murein DD-endopeptidase MepM/ murein hydrolase activator NlpD